MLLIVAALAEELSIALNLCAAPARLTGKSIRAYASSYKGMKLHLLKTGVGPQRSAQTLEQLITAFRPSQILAIGYAGALDPSLNLGDLIAVRHVLSLKGRSSMALEEMTCDESWDLPSCERLMAIGRSSNLSIQCGTALTSPYIIGEPEQKRFLFARFAATVVDMETAALAQIAQKAGIPFACIRSVSDTANDVFLAPLSYAPGISPTARALKIMTAGNWISRYGEWRSHAKAAQASLRDYLIGYLDTRLRDSTENTYAE